MGLSSVSSLVANFAGRAARSLGQTFAGSAGAAANISAENDFENPGLGSDVQLADLENKATVAGTTSTNRHVAALAERTGRDPRAEEEKRKDEDFKARVIRNVTEEFRERLAERMRGLQADIDRLNWEINRLRDIESRYMQGGVDALLPEDHDHLRENEPDIYERITNPDNIQKERELRAEADRTGDRSELEAFQKKIAGFDEAYAKKHQEREDIKNTLDKLQYVDENPDLFVLDQNNQFKTSSLNTVCQELNLKPEDVVSNIDLQLQVSELVTQKLEDADAAVGNIERDRKEFMEQHKHLNAQTQKFGNTL